jgi:hypothetical protein
MDDVGSLPYKKPKKLPNGNEITCGNLATHLRDIDGRHSMISGEVTHVIFAGRDGTGYENGLAVIALQPGGEPDNVAGRTPNI